MQIHQLQDRRKKAFDCESADLPARATEHIVAAVCCPWHSQDKMRHIRFEKTCTEKFSMERRYEFVTKSLDKECGRSAV